MRTEEGTTRGGELGFLVVQRSHRGGPRLGARLPLRTVNSLGRDVGNDVVVEDEAASARHALLEHVDGEWWVEDAGSTNGTALNGTRITQRERLRPGDELTIGRVALRLERS
jgi:pSer/pThr/pTyr-binding forkhead associated (FHA) protein